MSLKSTNGPGPGHTGIIARPGMVFPVPRFFRLKNGRVVGMHNTVQGNGKQCTLNNPCEVDEDGTISTYPWKQYSQRLKEITSCFKENGEFDLYLKACRLEKP